MPAFNRIIVTLDQSSMDDVILKYISTFYPYLVSEEIIFVHVEKVLDISPELLKEYSAIDLLSREDSRNHLEDALSKFSFEGIKTKTYLLQGSPIEEVLKLSSEESADLIVMGRKKTLKGSGIVSSHIARESHCSLLFVTEHFHNSLENILVPVDFSNHAAIAFNQAKLIADGAQAKVSIVNLFEVPVGYYKTGKSFEDFALIMEGHAVTDFQNFVKAYDLPQHLECSYLLNDDQSKGGLITNYAKNNAHDLIVIGSKGRTKSAAILLGSIAEKILYLQSSIPVLITKNKGENMGFFEALMKI